MPWKRSLLVLTVLLLVAGCVPAETPVYEEPSLVSPIVPSPRAGLRSLPVSTATVPEPSGSCLDAAPSPVATAASSLSASPVRGTPLSTGTVSTSSVSTVTTIAGTAEPTPAGPRLVSPRVVETPAPVSRIALRPDQALEDELRQAMGAEADGYAVAAIDLKTGRGVSINGERVFYAASVFKTWVMYEVLHQEALGLLSLADELVVTPYYDGFGLGPRGTALCGRYTVMELLEAMMSVSDNAAAVLLQDLVGAPNVNASMDALGLRDSRLTTEDIPITADDTALLLQIIGSGKAVSREASEVMGSLMLAETFDNGLVAGMPPGTAVAHKTGNWPNARHDAGIVFTDKTTYVVVMLSDNRDGSSATIKQLAGILFESFNR